MAILAFLANQESCFFGDIHEVLPIAKGNRFSTFERTERSWLNSRRNRNAKSTILYQPGKLGTRTKVIYYFLGIANVNVHRAVNNSTFFKIIVRSSTNYDYYINFKVELEMEIKVLGTGCSSCKALYETTKQAISELGLRCNTNQGRRFIENHGVQHFRSSGFGD